jgi:hypothetical protein
MIREKFFEGDDGIDLEGNEEKKMVVLVLDFWGQWKYRIRTIFHMES